MLHVFGCSITQGFALPDVVQTILDDQGQPLTHQQIKDRGIRWTDIHVYAASKLAWPQLLATELNMPVTNHARRGSCFRQIAAQCARELRTIQAEDTVIVMWTYMSRLSLQWPARTAVPFCNVVNPNWGWKTIIKGFNSLLGLTPQKDRDPEQDEPIHRYIYDRAQLELDPMGVYDRYYNNLVLQTATDGLLRSTGARVIHLSVETEPVLDQLRAAETQLDPSLRAPYMIADPRDWYTLAVDYDSCYVIHDPDIPPAENDMHPSVTHHRNFAEHIYQKYFTGPQE
jgi:hypothetical protein